jgi:tRNA G18 (ribose-2'-O)-methylase SpoU
MDAHELDLAAMDSLQNPTNGYDGRYGKSALKTYRAFLFPKKEEEIIQMGAAAARVARQIEFLVKRHKSHQAEFVRHHDSVAASRSTFPLVVLLDNVRSAFNVGSIFRTADATGCSLVITTGITPHPNGSGAEKLHKSALGAELVVPSRHFTTTQAAIEFIRSELPDYSLIGVETTERSVIYSAHAYAKQGAVLVLGNEVTGVDTEIMPELDVIVEIPMFGAKNSLNIAACAPVVLYEVLRQWNE